MSGKDVGHTCVICGSTDQDDLRPGVMVRTEIADLIRRDHPEFTDDSWICVDDLQKYRDEYVHSMLVDEKGELSTLEEEVLESLREQDTLSRNPDEDIAEQLTYGQRLADRIAEVGGSWRFIIIFLLSLTAWIAINSYFLLAKPFDPYPFILLNLMLSCIAAIQAPIIMMSQGRQEDRDRLHAQHDYQVNLKAELEIRALHQKIDHMLSHQWERLVEIQEIQLELIKEMRAKK